MITVSNYDEKKSSVKWNDLPAAVRNNRDDVEDMLELYGEDKTIDKMIDTFLIQLNKSPGKAQDKKQTAQAKKPDAANKNKKPVAKSKKKPNIEDTLLDAKYFRSYVPKPQMMVVSGSDEFIDDVERVDAELAKIPDEEQKGSIQDQIVYARYFFGESNWFVTEELPGNGAFGFAILNGDLQMAEAGTLPMPEIRSNRNVELDFHFKQGRKLKTILKEMYPDEYEDEKPAPKKKVAAKKVKKVVDHKIVANFSEEHKLLGRFLNFTKKELVTHRQVQLLYWAFNKAAVSRNIRKSSDKADEFELANKGITKLYNQSEDTDEAKDNGYELNIENTKLVKDLTDYISGTKINYAITLLRSFIGFQGTIPGKEKATRLLKRFTNAIKTERIDDKNRLYDQISDAKEELEEYLKTPYEKVDVVSYGLSAPRGICTNRIKCAGLNDKGQLKKGYRFLNGGTVVKSKKKGLGIVPGEVKDDEFIDFPGGEIIVDNMGDQIMLFFDGDKKDQAPVNLTILKKHHLFEWSDNNRCWVRSQEDFTSKDKLDLLIFLEAKPAKKKSDPEKPEGLSQPVEEYQVHQDKPFDINNYIVEPIEEEKTPVLPKKIPVKHKGKSARGENLQDAMDQVSNDDVFPMHGDIGKFMGQVEKKPVHSVVTTLDAEQGAGKTRFFFQVLNELAASGVKCLFYSLEEHPQSKLFKNKVDQYIDPANFKNITIVDEVEEWSKETAVINANEAIFFDSFQKLPQIDLDKDVRKAFNGKWFFVIYQQNGTKGMRGGSRAAFDGDIILKVKKGEDYRDNYVYANKNRYNDEPELKYNIFSKKLMGDHSQAAKPDIKPLNRLIATAIQ